MDNIKKELTPYEKAGMYEIISEIESETEITTTLKTYGGATVICHIPKHTPEEEKQLGANITRAMFKMIYPDKDLSGNTLRIIV